jgi:hypothetical protein
MRNYKKISATFLIILLPAMFISLYAQKSVELEYNVTKGDLYKTVMHLDQDIVFDANGQTMALNQVIDFKISAEVTDNTKEDFTTKSTIDAIKMTQSIFGMQITYDSEDSTTLQNPMVAKIAAAMSDLVGASYSMNMDHKGHVKDIDASAFSQNDDIANNISSGSGYAIYKEGKVKVGDSWDGDVTPLKNSDMKVNMTYTVLKISGKEVTLGINGTIKANNMEDQELNLDGTMSGEMIVSSHTGWLIKSVIDQEIKLDIEQNGQTMPATITGTITTTTEKVK